MPVAYLPKRATCRIYYLSKQNCDEIFGIVDVEKLGDSFFEKESSNILHPQHQMRNFFILGFNKAMELNKDKVFTESDVFHVVNHVLSKLVKVEGFDQKYLFPEEVYQEVTWKAKQIQQPTEIEVEIEMQCPHPMDTYRCGLQYGCDGDGCNHPNQIPYLDSEGCLILKKI